MALPNILQPKWKLFRDHHARITQRPDPVVAQEKFERRLLRSRRVTVARTVLFVLIYFSFIAAAVGFVLDYFQLVPRIGKVLDLLQTVASSLSLLFLAGVFVCNRYLGYLEVEMVFYSMETRLKPS